MTSVTEIYTARIAAHRNNINRYRHLLRTRLTEIEREFVERRLAEESRTLDKLMAQPRNFKVIEATPRHRRRPSRAKVASL